MKLKWNNNILNDLKQLFKKDIYDYFKEDLIQHTLFLLDNERQRNKENIENLNDELINIIKFTQAIEVNVINNLYIVDFEVKKYYILNLIM